MVIIVIGYNEDKVKQKFYGTETVTQTSRCHLGLMIRWKLQTFVLVLIGPQKNKNNLKINYLKS